MNVNKKTITTMLTLTLMISMFAAIFSVVNAHDPPWNMPMYAFLTVTPNPVGVNQEVIIYMWTQHPPLTAAGDYGDRWDCMELDITKPDGTKQTIGPLTSDPVGFAWHLFTPTQIGTYTFQFKFLGQTLEGENLQPGGSTGIAYIGDYFEPAISKEVELVVQEEPLEQYPTTPLPTDLWSRPISGEYRDWWSISGNWLANPPNYFAEYTEGPESSHILWTKPITFGGLVGGEFGTYSFGDGNAYEGKWAPPVIISGVLYYNKYPSNFGIPGFYAVDLRTGEELYYKDDIRISFGQIYMYDSPNQHGAFAYLWSTSGSTWKCYDAFSGDWWYTIENVSSGTRTYGPDGSMLIHRLDTRNDRLTVWSSSAIPELLQGPTGSAAWSWRPYGKTVDGNNGYVLNVSIPTDLSGGIIRVLDDKIMGQTGLASGGGRLPATEEYTVWCLNIKAGQEGQLLWKKTYTNPDRGSCLSLRAEGVSGDDGVFVLFNHETLQWRGYSLDTGELLWGPTEPQAAWDQLSSMRTAIGYGKLLSTSTGGTVYAYDIATGNLEWTYVASDPYYMEAKWGGSYPMYIAFIADGKAYTFQGEHSPDDPKERGCWFAAVDMETGEELWRIPFYGSRWARNPAIADGIIVYLNAYDNLIYAYGKGPSATTVTAPKVAITLGQSVVIEGTVTDQTPASKDTPAISDEDISAWMEYLYMNGPIPSDATGVEVTIDVIDSNGNYRNIGTTSSDLTGTYALMWEPDIPGEYTIIATFAGSGSYGSSFAQTYLGVVEPPQPTPPEATPAAMTDTYLTGSTIAILAGIAIAVFLILRKK